MTEQEHEKALKRIDYLMDLDLNTEEEKELDKLVDEVQEYERGIYGD